MKSFCTSGRNRTGTSVTSPDFESSASTSSATDAFRLKIDSNKGAKVQIFSFYANKVLFFFLFQFSSLILQFQNQNYIFKYWLCKQVNLKTLH